ncbi:hypothetical protein SCYAM73S_06850 [Streptomyces cyaneofuscatus]
MAVAGRCTIVNRLAAAAEAEGFLRGAPAVGGLRTAAERRDAADGLLVETLAWPGTATERPARSPRPSPSAVPVVRQLVLPAGPVRAGETRACSVTGRGPDDAGARRAERRRSPSRGRTQRPGLRRRTLARSPGRPSGRRPLGGGEPRLGPDTGRHGERRGRAGPPPSGAARVATLRTPERAAPVLAGAVGPLEPSWSASEHALARVGLRHRDRIVRELARVQERRWPAEARGLAAGAKQARASIRSSV